MRYIETNQGLIFAPSQQVSHGDLANLLEPTQGRIFSAGFFAARYSADTPWKIYGKSSGLGLSCNPELQIPTQVWAGVCDEVLQTVIYSTNPKLLSNLQNVEECTWGLSEEGLFGECAVFTPLHSKRPLRADEIIGL